MLFTVPDLQYGTPHAKFRHDDHRFEWTRQQFKDWANGIAETYGYEVSFSGVGYKKGSTQVQDVGPCTQIAVFTRIKELDMSTRAPLLPLQPYRLHKVIEFPFFEEDGFTNDDIIQEVAQLCSNLIYSELSRIYHGIHGNADTHEDYIKSRWSVDARDVVLSDDVMWGDLRIRQLAKTKARLAEVLESQRAKEIFNIYPSNPVTLTFRETPPYPPHWAHPNDPVESDISDSSSLYFDEW
jgi:hypothetical protein